MSTQTVLSTDVTEHSARDRITLVGFVMVMLAAVTVAPSWDQTLVQVAVIGTVALSLDVQRTRLGAWVPFQPGVVALTSWLTTILLGHNQSPVITLLLAIMVGLGAGALGLLAREQRALTAVLVLAGLGASVTLAAVSPAMHSYIPAVFLGLDMSTPRAAVASALLALLLGAWIHRNVSSGDIGRWLAVARDAPELLPRAGVSSVAVWSAGLAASGAIAGIAGWAAAAGTLGAPGLRALEPAVIFVWLLAPVAGGPGISGAIMGAAAVTGVIEVAGIFDRTPLVLAAPLLAVLLLRRRGAQ